MNINQIEWCSYTEGNPDYVQEIEFLEWQSDPEGKFCKSDECNLKIMQIFSKSLKKCLKKFLLGMELPIRNLKRL